MKCILLRHGIAVDRAEWSGKERDRPLTKEGIDKTRKAVNGLYQISNQLTHLLSSPFTRAFETAQIVNEVFELDEDIQICQELMYHHSPVAIFPVLTQLSDDAHVVCVGHEPHLGQLAATMISGRNVPGLSLKKAGACLIEFEEKPKIGDGELKWWLQPAQLRLLRKG